MSLWLAFTQARLDVLVRDATGIDATESRTLLASVESEIERVRPFASDVPATWLRSRLGLSATEEQILWLVITCEVTDLARTTLLALSAERYVDPTISLIQRVVFGAAPTLEGWREVGPEGRLFRLGLLVRTDDGGSRISEHRQTVRVASRVRALALGDRGVCADLPAASLVETSAPLADIVVSSDIVERLSAQLTNSTSFVVVAGARGTGRATLLRAAAVDQGYRILEVALDRLPVDAGGLADALRAVAREAQLLGCAVLLRDLEVLRSASSESEERLRILESELIARIHGPILATAAPRTPRLRCSRPVITLELRSLVAEQRALLWSRAIPGCGENDLEVLSGRYSFAPSVIVAVGDAVRARCDGLPTEAQLLESIDAVVDDRLSGLATRVEVTQTWDDLVLPEDQLGALSELLARVRERTLVYEQWGFSAKLGKGLGVNALLSGPPGTGKTMAAGLIAKDLGLPLYRVDLAQMVSKYIGETEKHLSALFDAAESGHAILLFDEADSLFGKRTEVKSSNDRYANLEVNYLLQRIEAFTGICLLTTNHEHAIDAAFQRRIAFHIRFPVPAEAERTQLWRALLPAAAPIVSELDFDALGRRIALSGGQIRNAVLRAAFLAADERASISMDHLWTAAVAECEAAGRIVGSL